MSRSLRWLRASLFACFAATLIAASPATATGATGTAAGVAAGGAVAEAMTLPSEQLALAVIANGVSSDPIVVRRQGPIAWVAAADLRRLGIAVQSADAQVLLNTIPGLSYDIDTVTQTLTLTFRPRRERLSARGPPDDGVPVTPNGWGGLINYDAVATRGRGNTALSALVEGVVYAPHGHAFANAVIGVGDRGPERRFRRLDTGVTFADPDRARRLTVGDYVNGGNAFSRPVRMAGVKIGTDFALRPDLVTFPLPAISGQAAVPSSVDLVVNGSKVASRDVRAGDFALSDVPVQTGLNSISVSVRDALGRQTIQTSAIYASAALLRPGLGAYSLEAGWVRTGFASRDDRYRRFAGTGTGRIGISRTLTLQGHFEVGAGTAIGGGGGVIGLGRWGVLDGNAMVSRTRGRGGGGRGGGTQFSAAWERVARPISLAARYTRTSDNYTDIARRYGTQTRRDVFTANIGFDLRRAGQLSASLVSLGRGLVPRDAARSDRLTASQMRSQLIVGTYSVHVAKRLNLIANVGGDTRRRRSLFASVGLTATLGPQTAAYGGASYRSGGPSADAQLVKSALFAGDWGYRAQASTGTFDRVSGAVEYLGTHGRVAGELEVLNGAVAGRLSGRGAIVVAGGEAFLSDRINTGFAIVDTERERGVPVFRDNRPVGRTGRSGKLLVPNLPAYIPTKLTIDPDALNQDVTVDRAEVYIKPAERAGVRVRPGVRRDRSLIVRLVDEHGQPLPVGSRALLHAGGGELPIGFDGDLFVAVPLADNLVRVALPDGAFCSVRFSAPAVARPGQRIGPLTCAGTARIAALGAGPVERLEPTAAAPPASVATAEHGATATAVTGSRAGAPAAGGAALAARDESPARNRVGTRPAVRASAPVLAAAARASAGAALLRAATSRRAIRQSTAVPVRSARVARRDATTLRAAIADATAEGAARAVRGLRAHGRQLATRRPEQRTRFAVIAVQSFASPLPDRMARLWPPTRSRQCESASSLRLIALRSWAVSTPSVCADASESRPLRLSGPD